MVALLHTPQLEELKTFRVSLAGSNALGLRERDVDDLIFAVRAAERDFEDVGCVCG